MMAFTFTREIYSSWKRGGRVWLAEPEDGDNTQDPDSGEDDLLHLLHVSCTFAADAAKNENKNPAAIYGTDEVSSRVQDDRSLFAAKLENTQTPSSPVIDTGACVCVPGICSKLNEIPEESAVIDNPDQELAPRVCCSLQQTAGNVQQITSPAANNLDLKPAAAPEVSTIKKVAPALTLAQVNPGDYSRKPDNNQVFSYNLKRIKS